MWGRLAIGLAGLTQMSIDRDPSNLRTHDLGGSLERVLDRAPWRAHSCEPHPDSSGCPAEILRNCAYPRASPRVDAPREASRTGRKPRGQTELSARRRAIYCFFERGCAPWDSFVSPQVFAAFRVDGTYLWNEPLATDSGFGAIGSSLPAPAFRAESCAAS